VGVVLRAAVIVAAGAGLVWGGHQAWAALAGQGTPSCTWRLQVRGKATAEQARLVRCYLRALAHRDAAGLLAVADDIPPVRVTSADLAHSADARTGLATATFTPSPVDSDYALLTVVYADGARDTLGLQNMRAMGGPSTWRMAIGTETSPGPKGPPTAAPDPHRPAGS
jgi:hypothetical protein